jgi:hypothetical protein
MIPSSPSSIKPSAGATYLGKPSAQQQMTSRKSSVPDATPVVSIPLLMSVRIAQLTTIIPLPCNRQAHPKDGTERKSHNWHMRLERRESLNPIKKKEDSTLTGNLGSNGSSMTD